MNANTSQVCQVRREYTEESVWRDVLGNAEPLRCFVTYGPLDAHDWLPAGAMHANKYGPMQATAMRDGWWG